LLLCSYLLPNPSLSTLPPLFSARCPPVLPCYSYFFDPFSPWKGLVPKVFYRRKAWPLQPIEPFFLRVFNFFHDNDIFPSLFLPFFFFFRSVFRIPIGRVQVGHFLPATDLTLRFLVFLSLLSARVFCFEIFFGGDLRHLLFSIFHPVPIASHPFLSQISRILTQRCSFFH